MISGAVEGVVVGLGTGVGKLIKDGVTSVYNETSAVGRQVYDWATNPASKTQTVDDRLVRVANNSAVRDRYGAPFMVAQAKKEVPQETQRFIKLCRLIDAKNTEIDNSLKEMDTLLNRFRYKSQIEQLKELQQALKYLKPAKTLAALRITLAVKKSLLEKHPLTSELVTAINEPVELEKTFTEKAIGNFYALLKR